MKHLDFIIVGQGLAGTVLALKLIDHGFSIKVIDEPDLSACSKIAAGIYNPVVFKRLSKSWMIDELMPEMLYFYNKQEEKLKCKLITERNIVKLFSEEQEIQLWQKKASSELDTYIDKTIYTDSSYENIQLGDLGFSKVIRSGNLDVKLFLDKAREYFATKESYLKDNFDFKEFRLEETISYKNLKANNIIFCEGHLIRKNPLFNYIPLKPAKGEVLTIASKKLSTGNDIINKNAFLMQVSDNVFKVGATYNWDDLSDIPTREGKEEIESKLRKMISTSYEIMAHEAGVRPSVIDRRPVMGEHPKHKNSFVFNGMGTKGVMLAPYFAEHFIGHLTKKTPLNKEVDITRFNKFL